MLSFETPLGGNKKYIIKCNGQPYAGFDKYEQAEAALKMYKRNPNDKDGISKHNWELTTNS